LGLVGSATHSLPAPFEVLRLSHHHQIVYTGRMHTYSVHVLCFRCRLNGFFFVFNIAKERKPQKIKETFPDTVLILFVSFFLHLNKPNQTNLILDSCLGLLKGRETTCLRYIFNSLYIHLAALLGVLRLAMASHSIVVIIYFSHSLNRGGPTHPWFRASGSIHNPIISTYYVDVEVCHCCKLPSRTDDAFHPPSPLRAA